jgi:hypothetical protein
MAGAGVDLEHRDSGGKDGARVTYQKLVTR